MAVFSGLDFLTRARALNVIVRVHSDSYEMHTCLRGVLKTLPPEAMLTIVHDAEPELERLALLRELEGDARVTVVWKVPNPGFAGSVNRGMRVHPDRDVLLLDADREVFDGWIERLTAAAYSRKHIGSVTPLGESASVVTYPGRAASAAALARRIDYIARHVNADKVVQIPVGMPFCLYLRRECLEDVGEFDELSFEQASGEAIDFCLRARTRGWWHVAAPNVFVRHSDVGATVQALSAHDEGVITQRYPGYGNFISKFLALDPLLKYKRAIDEERVLNASRRTVLMLGMGLPDAIERTIEERQAELTAAGHSVIEMHGTPGNVSGGRVRLESSDETLEYLSFDLPGDIDVLRMLLHRLRLQRVEVHHHFGLPPAALDLAVGLGVPYEVFVHDDAETNQAAGVAQLERSARILKAARRIVAPNEAARTRLLRVVPEVSIEVTPSATDAGASSAPH